LTTKSLACGEIMLTLKNRKLNIVKGKT